MNYSIFHVVTFFNCLTKNVFVIHVIGMRMLRVNSRLKRLYPYILQFSILFFSLFFCLLFVHCLSSVIQVGFFSSAVGNLGRTENFSRCRF